MKKLIKGIVEFRKNIRTGYRETFGKLALGQSPDALFIACSDSRVVPDTFASTDPGDLFVLRNVGNMVPPCGGHHGLSKSDESEAAAIEFAVQILEVSDIIVCGHSECGAMRALISDRNKIVAPNLRNWLRHGEVALERFRSGLTFSSHSNPSLSDSSSSSGSHSISSSGLNSGSSSKPHGELGEHNQLSQVNVLLQMENIKSYPVVQKRIEERRLRIHGLWFDLTKADVYAYEEDMNRFILIDEVESQRILKRLDEN